MDSEGAPERDCSSAECFLQPKDFGSAAKRFVAVQNSAIAEATTNYWHEVSAAAVRVADGCSEDPGRRRSPGTSSSWSCRLASERTA